MTVIRLWIRVSFRAILSPVWWHSCRRRCGIPYLEVILWQERKVA